MGNHLRCTYFGKLTFFRFLDMHILVDVFSYDGMRRSCRLGQETIYLIALQSGSW